jgi:hypothetical protein
VGNIPDAVGSGRKKQWLVCKMEVNVRVFLKKQLNPARRHGQMKSIVVLLHKASTPSRLAVGGG